MDTNPPAPTPIHPHGAKHAPLTYSQESLWFMQQLDPDNNAYNSNFLLKLSGGIDHEVLQKALNDLVDRQEALRTLYPSKAGIPIQEIQPFQSITLPFIDFSNLQGEQGKEAVEKYVEKLGRPTYDLQYGPLTRYAHLRLSPVEDFFFLSTHHINSDAWSREIFKRELLQFYTANLAGEKPQLKNLPIQFSDYAQWQKEWMSGDVLKTFTDHWKGILSGELPVLDLPTDHPRPSMQTYRGVRYQFAFSPALVSQVKSFCLKYRITPFHLYMAAFLVLLMHYSGQEDIIVGCPFANRSHAELENLIGLFVNTLPIRMDLSANPKVEDLVNKIRETMLDAFAWQAAPFEAIVSEISPERDLSRTPIFQVAINMRNIPRQTQLLEDELEAESILAEDVPAPFDLSLEFDDASGSMMTALHYNADLFDEKTIIRMAAHFQNLLSGFIANPGLAISDVEMLTASEKKRILSDVNETAQDFPQVCVQDLVDEQAGKTPESIAVICNGHSITYGQLITRSNQLANYLIGKGVKESDRVGIYLPRSENSIVALLAILKAGAAYIALELANPPVRIEEMVKDADPIFVLTHASLENQLPAGTPLICLDSEEEAIAACQTRNPEILSDINSAMYLLYTSGSTGKPKASVNLHKGVVNFLVQMNRQFNLGPAESILQLTSLAFDLSVFDIFGFLASGGTIFMMDDAQMRDPDFINSEIDKQRVTYVSGVPTMLRALSESRVSREKTDWTPKWIISVGEALLRSDVELFRKAFGESTQILNFYGPSECSVGETMYVVPPVLPEGLQVIPIGKPIQNTYTYILDKHLRQVPAGSRGELFIGGVGVGGGYWNNPALTEERYLPDPFHQGEKMYRSGDMVRQLPDGTICFLGRTDDQLKIRGYRVEIGEIESLLKELPGVKDAAVKFWRSERTNSLLSYISLQNADAGHIKEDLRRHLSDRLPFYMLPADIIVLDDFPHTATGKIDRKRLPLPDNQSTDHEYVAPRTEIEKRLVAIWENVLNQKNIGVKDNFFSLGGHSLLAVRMFSMIQAEFGQTLPLLVLFKESTIEALATFLSKEDHAEILDGIVQIKPEGDKPALFILPAGLYVGKLAEAMGKDRPVNALYPYENGKRTYRGSIQETAGIYYRCLVNYQPEGPYLLIGHSADGHYALELARLLRQAGKEVAFLGMIDTYPPGSPLRINWADRLHPHLEQLARNNFLGNIKYLWRAVQRESARAKRIRIAKRTIKLHQQDTQEMKGRLVLLRAYKPEPYDGDAHIFSVSSRPGGAKSNPMQRWSDFITGNLDIVPVEGDHMSILEEPQVNGLAQKIREIIDHPESNRK